MRSTGSPSQAATIEELKRLAVERGHLTREAGLDESFLAKLQALNGLGETIVATHNISGDDNASRLIWSENLERVLLEGKRRAPLTGGGKGWLGGRRPPLGSAENLNRSFLPLSLDWTGIRLAGRTVCRQRRGQALHGLAMVEARALSAARSRAPLPASEWP